MSRPMDTTLSRVFLKTLELSIGPRWGQPKDVELEGKGVTIAFMLGASLAPPIEL